MLERGPDAGEVEQLRLVPAKKPDAAPAGGGDVVDALAFERALQDQRVERCLDAVRELGLVGRLEVDDGHFEGAGDVVAVGVLGGGDHYQPTLIAADGLYERYGLDRELVGLTDCRPG